MWLLRAVPLVLALWQGASTVPAVAGRAAPAAAFAGGIGIRLLAAPMSGRSDPRAARYITDHVAPGAVVHRKVQITNTSDTPRHVDVYAGAATIGGGTFTAAPGRTPDELTRWVSFRSNGSDLPARSNALVEATIKVPRSASAGERYAVIWAQETSSPSSTSSVQTADRVGVRVYLDVGPGGEPPSDFRIEDLTLAHAPDGTPELLATVRNTGARALDLSGSAALVDAPGAPDAGPFPVSPDTTLGIGDTGAVTVPLDRRLPGGPRTVRLTLTSGLVQHIADSTLRFPGAAAPGAPASPDSAGFGRSLTLGYTAFVCAVLAVLYAYHVNRSRRASTRSPMF